MYRNDNWGWRARIGMFIVASEPIPEAEWWAMMPSGVSVVHAARVSAPPPWASWDDARTTVSPAPDLADGAGEFAAMRLNAVAVGHSSSSFLGGKGWDEAVIESLSGSWARASSPPSTAWTSWPHRMRWRSPGRSWRRRPGSTTPPGCGPCLLQRSRYRYRGLHAPRLRS